MKKTILVVDFGTSKVHVNIIDCGNGEIVCGSSKGYQIIVDEPGKAEIDPEELWRAAEETVGNVTAGLSDEIHIEGISFSYFGDNIIAVQEDGKPLTNIILAFDTRQNAQKDELSRAIGEDTYRRLTGGICNSDDTGAKILWLKETCPEIFEKAAYYDTNQQFVLRRLGLEPLNDMTMASRKMLFNVAKREWCQELLTYIGITEESLGNVVDSDTVVGEITEFGDVKFAYPIPVIIGGHDCDLGMIGAGVDGSRTDAVVDITGTWDHLGLISLEPIDTEIVVKNGTMHTFCGPIRNSTVILGAYPTSGVVLDWFMRVINSDMSQEAYGKLWKAADFTRPGEEIFYPDFAGGHGMWRNLGLGTTKVRLFQSVIEALTFEAKRIITICEETKGQGFSKVYIGGGAARSKKWLQLRADIFDRPIILLKNIEISSLGAAITAAAGLGIYDTTAQAIENMTGQDAMFTPDKEIRKFYEEKYKAYIGGQADGKGQNGSND